MFANNAHTQCDDGVAVQSKIVNMFKRLDKYLGLSDLFWVLMILVVYIVFISLLVDFYKFLCFCNIVLKRL